MSPRPPSDGFFLFPSHDPAFTAELGDKDDCVMILKTYGSGEARTPQHVAENVNKIRNVVIKENKKKPSLGGLGDNRY